MSTDDPHAHTDTAEPAEPDPADEVLTIEEAARVLRIGRNAAYGLAHEWRATGGRTGLPCVQLGRALRVPRNQLQDLLAGRIGAQPHGDTAA